MNESNQYLIAANSKRAQLIFNIFRPIDLWVELGGIAVTMVLFFIVDMNTLLKTILVLLPLMITTFLVLPIPNYQNVLCILQNIYVYLFVERQQFKWRGWCAKYEFKD